MNIVTCDESIAAGLQKKIENWYRANHWGMLDRIMSWQPEGFTRLEGMDYWATCFTTITGEEFGIHIYDDGRIARIN